MIGSSLVKHGQRLGVTLVAASALAGGLALNPTHALADEVCGQICNNVSPRSEVTFGGKSVYCINGSRAASEWVTAYDVKARLMYSPRCSTTWVETWDNFVNTQITPNTYTYKRLLACAASTVRHRQPIIRANADKRCVAPNGGVAYMSAMLDDNGVQNVGELTLTVETGHREELGKPWKTERHHRKLYTTPY